MTYSFLTPTYNKFEFEFKLVVKNTELCLKQSAIVGGMLFDIF